MLAKVLTAIGLASAGLLLIVVTTTSPSDAGALGILAVFLLSYVVLFTSLTFIVWFLAKVFYRISTDLHLRKKNQLLTLKIAYYYATVIALGPIIIVSLQSVGGVGIYELLLVAVFIILGCLYVSRRTS